VDGMKNFLMLSCNRGKEGEKERRSRKRGRQIERKSERQRDKAQKE
jgi:hypothetical protein